MMYSILLFYCMYVDFSHEEFREVSFVDPSVCDASNCCSGFVQEARYNPVGVLILDAVLIFDFFPSSFVD